MDQITLNYLLSDQIHGTECPEKSSQPFEVPKTNKNAREKKPLLTKIAVEFLLNGTLKYKVCKYCLNLSSELSELDQIFQVASKGSLYSVTIKDMISAFHPFQVAKDNNLPSKICNKCLNRTISAYLFTQQCERAERAIQNCFNDIYEKFEKLDPLVPKRKQGRKKLKVNNNVLHVSHATVMDYAEPIVHLINRGSALLNGCQNTVISELECLKCWQVLPDYASLVKHQKIHPKEMWYHCRLCGNSFSKLLHWRKHIKSCHTQQKNIVIPAKEETNAKFNCRECGEVNDNHLQHLQHIEKHKFKKVLEQLLAKKMDDMCTVCLDKGHSMVELDKMVAFHGGCPELSGDRSLYSILGSTLPDQRHTYKYQQLLIPNSANVLKITKKNTEHCNSKREIAISTRSENHKVFVFSAPLEVGSKNTKYCIEDDFYSFKFSEPASVETVYANDEWISSPTNVVFNKEKHAINPLSYPETINSTSEGNNVTSNILSTENEKALNAEAVNENLSTFVHVELNTVRKPLLCKILNCSECLNNSYATENKGEQKMIVHEKFCQFCWVFAKTDKCYICLKTNTASEVTQEPSIANEKLDSLITSVQETKKYYECTEKKHPEARKRKTDFGNGKQIKRIKWQCNVCLTVNDNNRGTCYCCDTNKNVVGNEMPKINSGFKETMMFELKEPGNEKIEDIILNTTVNSESHGIKNLVNEDADMIIMEEDDHLSKLKLLITADYESHEMMNIKDADMINMERTDHQPNNELFSIQPNKFHLNVENSMDVATYETTADISSSQVSVSTLLPVNNTFNNFMLNPLATGINAELTRDRFGVSSVTFNIGAGNSGGTDGPRRIKKPIRRITSHK